MSKNYVDYKATQWRRAHFKDTANMQAIKDMIASGDFEDIFNEELGLDGVEDIADLSEDCKDGDGNQICDIFENNERIYENL